MSNISKETREAVEKSLLRFRDKGEYYYGCGLLFDHSIRVKNDHCISELLYTAAECAVCIPDEDLTRTIFLEDDSLATLCDGFQYNRRTLNAYPHWDSAFLPKPVMELYTTILKQSSVGHWFPEDISANRYYYCRDGVANKSRDLLAVTLLRYAWEVPGIAARICANYLEYRDADDAISLMTENYGEVRFGRDGHCLFDGVDYKSAEKFKEALSIFVSHVDTGSVCGDVTDSLCGLSYDGSVIWFSPEYDDDEYDEEEYDDYEDDDYEEDW